MGALCGSHMAAERVQAGRENVGGEIQEGGDFRESLRPLQPEGVVGEGQVRSGQGRPRGGCWPRRHKPGLCQTDGGPWAALHPGGPGMAGALQWGEGLGIQEASHCPSSVPGPLQPSCAPTRGHPTLRRSPNCNPLGILHMSGRRLEGGLC